MSTLSVMKHEYIHQNKASNDFIKDLEITKKIYDNVCQSSSSIKGYVQEIHCEPFGYILFSDLQVKSLLLIILIINF